MSLASDIAELKRWKQARTQVPSFTPEEWARSLFPTIDVEIYTDRGTITPTSGSRPTAQPGAIKPADEGRG
jgi:hypothetical protein